ncbi:hypothetical protein TNCV_472321 [Trichonephila clavipes]|nr:hypothetical protein TNCV_472321 [Trichonephila clavipes]
MLWIALHRKGRTSERRIYTPKKLMLWQREMFIFVDGMTAMAGSNVVQSGRPIFNDFFQHLWLYIGNNTANVVFQNGQAFVAYPHRPMTLHSPTENSLAVLNHKILEAN